MPKAIDLEAAALARVEALEGLLACYRVGRQPTEKLHRELEASRVRLALAKLHREVEESAHSDPQPSGLGSTERTATIVPEPGRS